MIVFPHLQEPEYASRWEPCKRLPQETVRHHSSLRDNPFLRAWPRFRQCHLSYVRLLSTATSGRDQCSLPPQLPTGIRADLNSLLDHTTTTSESPGSRFWETEY